MSPTSLGLALLAGIGLVQAQDVMLPPVPKFEVTSVKPCRLEPPIGRKRADTSSPGRLATGCNPLVDNLNLGAIQLAYVAFTGGKSNSELLSIHGGPNWIRQEPFEITAVAKGNPGVAIMKGPMLQALLEDRFKLKIHRETKEGNVYALTVIDDSKLKRWREQDCALRTPEFSSQQDAKDQRICEIRMGPYGGNPTRLLAEGSMIEDVTGYLGTKLDRPIINKTGLAGRFNIRLDFWADVNTPEMADKGPDGQQMSPTPTGMTLFEALQKQVGLKLTPTKGPVEFLVIDQAERPSEN